MTGPRLRIAMTSFYLPSDSKIGVGYVAHRLANALVERGHAVTMFSPCARPDDARYDHRLVELHGRWRTFRWGWAVARLDLRGFDVVHCHGDNHLRAPWRSPPVIRTMHGSCLSEAFRIHGAREKLRMLALAVTEVVGSSTARRTIAVSTATRRDYPWIRRVIPNGVDRSAFHPGVKESRPTIVFVGTYEQRKRGRLLMEVFEREVRPAVPDAVLWMVCSDAPPAPGVEVLGRLSDAELADRYRRAWVFCLPSSYEGFGVPYIEAMSSGTAVVATPNIGAREVLDDGRYGEIVEPAALGAALVRLLTDEGARHAAAEAGRRRSEEFDERRVVSLYEGVYSEVLGARAGS